MLMIFAVRKKARPITSTATPANTSIPASKLMPSA